MEDPYGDLRIHTGWTRPDSHICNKKTGWLVQENEKFESRCSEVSVERAHSQRRSPAWNSFLASD